MNFLLFHTLYSYYTQHFYFCQYPFSFFLKTFHRIPAPYKIIAPATCEGVIFVFSCGRSHILFTCCCDHTSRASSSPLKVRLLLLCRNAIKHFVHWRLPLLLFLSEVPLGGNINHFKITSFSYSVRLLVGWTYVYVGVSPFPSVLLCGVIQIIPLYLLFIFS